MSHAFILDASVIVKWLNHAREQHTDQAMDILQRGVADRWRLYTSDLATHEVLNVLIKGKNLKAKELERAVSLYFELPLLKINTNKSMAMSAAIIAELQNITFYDAVYLSIAQQFDVSLITANPKHQKPSEAISVIPLSEWNTSLYV